MLDVVYTSQFKKDARRKSVGMPGRVPLMLSHEPYRVDGQVAHAA